MSVSHFKMNILKVLAPLVLMLGVMTLTTVIYPRPTYVDSILDAQIVEKISSERRPASIISLSESMADTIVHHSKMLTLELPCAESLNDFSSAAKQIRLKIQKCSDENIQDVEMSIYNSTNQFKASLFQLNEQHYSTDYIYLREGDNVINIEKTTRHSKDIQSSQFVVRRIVDSPENF